MRGIKLNWNFQWGGWGFKPKTFHGGMDIFWKATLKYRKIPIISPGLIFVQKAVLLGLFLGELIFGGACYWKEFCVSK